MSLPKRDGVHGRYYLIHKPDTDPEVLVEADLCIQRHLSRLPLKEFPCEDAVSICDAMRRLVGWEEIRYELEKYIEKQVQERCFLVGEREDGFTVFPPCTVRPELRPEDVDEGLLRFACYVAVCHTVYGQSFESLTTEHILGLVFQIRPDMVKELKTNGSGKLPKNIQQRKTVHFTCARCWSRRNSPAVTRWSAEERRKSICPFPACPRRESINSLPALCNTPICIRL